MRLIDADKFLAQIEDQYMEHDITRAQYLDLEDRILQQPTVDAVQVKHGHWKEDPSGYGFWICSACGFVSEASAANMLYKFCPNCGADMRKGGDHHG